MGFYGFRNGLGRGLNCPAGYSCPRLGYNFFYGALIGVGISAASFYIYKKNQDKIDEKLKKHGLKLGCSAESDYNTMKLDDLLKQKELIEEAISKK